MTVAIAITPVSGSITSKSTVCKVAVTGADVNTLTGYSTGIYPQKPAMAYFLRGRLTGQDDLKSYVFNVASDGTHLFNSLVFPAAGTWTVTLRNNADDSQVATLSVVVA